MLVVDAVIVVVVVAIVVTFIASRVVRVNARPEDSAELARAARLLERVQASDDTMPQLPAALRQEVDVFVARYYKELER
jgi:hypothetical protein